MFRIGGAAAVVCALGLLTAGSGTALAATCSSATENGISYGDPYGDAMSGLAPDIVGGAIVSVSNCGFGVGYEVGDQAAMADGDFLSWFIDTDDNLTTGSPSGFRGADHALGRLPNGYVGLSRYNSATGSFDVVKEGFPLGEFGAGVHLSDFDASPGVTFRVAGGSSWRSPSGASYFDFAPNTGTIGFGVNFLSASGPGAAPVQPGQPQQPVEEHVPTPGEDPIRNGPTLTDDPDGCTVPVLRGRTLNDAKRRLKAANCRVGRVTRVKSKRYAGRVVKSSPGSGRTLRSGAKVNLAVGKPRARSSMHVVSNSVAVDTAIDALAQVR